MPTSDASPTARLRNKLVALRLTVENLEGVRGHLLERGDVLRAVDLFIGVVDSEAAALAAGPTAGEAASLHKPYEDIARTPFEAFGHNEYCGKWVEGEHSISLDKDRACTCGGREADPDGPPEAAGPAAGAQEPK